MEFQDIQDQVKDRVRHVGVYMGGQCNFNCSYCDRDAIRAHSGYMKMTDADVDGIVNFHKHFMTGPGEIPIDYLTFYGGEPFIWIDIIDKIITRINEEICTHMKFHIVTNGGYLLQNRWFFEKWKDKIMISLSYDFNYQTELRENPTNSPKMDIDGVLDMMKECGTYIVELYYTFPTFKKDAFHVDRLGDVVKLFSRHDNIRKLNILPVRFTNKPNEGFIDYIKGDFPVGAFFKKLKQFCELLYIYNIPVCIDGATDKGLPIISQKMLHIISPDGYLYNDYVFVEYQHEPARIGKWRDGIELYEFKEPHLPKCVGCSEFGYCNDKYYYYLWADENAIEQSKCVEFNKLIANFLTTWINKLSDKRDLLEHIK